MRNDKIIPGLVLIMIGAVILLHNYGYIHFHWGNFFYLWPIFIVIGGINLIFAHNRSPWATGLKIGVVVLGFGLIVFGDFGKHHGFWNNNTFTYHDNDDDDDNDDDNDTTETKNGIVKVEGNSEFNQPFTAGTKIAKLNITGGGTIYALSDTTNQLFQANTHEFKGKYEFSHSQEDSVAVLNFNMKGKHGFDFDIDVDDNDKDNGKTNSATFKLNTDPQWDINVKTGATKLDFDLTKFKVRNLKLSGGAAAFDVKLGQPAPATNVEVATGMSSTVINIPANAACRINSSTGLSSTNFDGFTKNNDGTYETPGFSSAKNKIYIKMSGGMADFKVKRY